MLEPLKIDRLKKIFNRFGANLLDAVFPVECFGCGREGEWVCPDCFKDLAYKEKQYCLGCKKENRFGEFCPGCAGDYFLEGVLIAGDYDNELLSRTIKNVKYHLVKDATGYLGNYLAAFLINEINKAKVAAINLKEGRIWEKLSGASAAPGFFFNPDEAMIIPVPLSKKRARTRGFNQAELMAGALTKRLSFSVESGFLNRVIHKIPQAKLGEEKRKKNVSGCYAWVGRNLDGRGVVLIDDVATTGATLNECARILKENGAGEVWGLVVAKG
ncbi:MAG: double zinc ribbon domain-containing protein [Patescibacteria group bacterium]|jgi:ComF family protein